MDLDIPIYSAVYLTSELLVVAGGGGKGKHGIPNKVALLDTSEGSVQVAQEYSFAPGSDCPMSLAIHDSRVVVGINSDTKNTHMQLFSDKLEPLTSHTLFGVKDAYQRATAATETHIAAVGAANSGNSPLVVLNTKMAVTWENDLKTDLRDLSFNRGIYLAGLEPAAVHFYQVESGKEEHTLKAPKGAKFTRGQFISRTKYVVAVQYPAKKRVELHVYEIEDKPMLANSTRISLSSVSALSSNADKIAVGSTSGEVQVFNTRLAVLQRAKKVHKLPVSAIAVSAEGDVASTSVAGTVHVFSAPLERSAFAGFAVAGWAFVSVAVLAILVTVVYSRIQNLTHFATTTTSTAAAHSAVPVDTAPVPGPDDNLLKIQTVANPEPEILVDTEVDGGIDEDVTITVTEVEEIFETVTVVEDQVYSVETTVYEDAEDAGPGDSHSEL